MILLTSLKWPMILLKALGLSSLQWTIASQESRLLWISEEDASTRFFHAHAFGRRRGKHIRSLSQDGQTLVNEESKVAAAFMYFDIILGTLAQRHHAINLQALGVPSLDL
jgi:hypothetical protein